jgi:hypothetical protein
MVETLTLLGTCKARGARSIAMDYLNEGRRSRIGIMKLRPGDNAGESPDLSMLLISEELEVDVRKRIGCDVRH